MTFKDLKIMTLRGWGADQELKLAEAKGCKIFRKLEEVPQV